MFFAFIFTIFQLIGYVPVPLHFTGGLATLVILGLIDDMYDLYASSKIIVQTAAVVFMVLPDGVLLWDLGNLFGNGHVYLSTWAAPFTIIAMVGVINAVNMLDGLDGLAGGVSLIALLWLAIAAWIIGLEHRVILLLCLASGVLGFLVFNMRHPWRSRASVFMGDAGSMMLGSALAWFAVDVSQSRGANGNLNIASAAILWIVALPLIDSVSLFVRRAAAGQNPMKGDRRHLHHILLKAGFSDSVAVYILLGVSAVLGGIGIAAWSFRVPDWLILAGFLVPILLHSWFVFSIGTSDAVRGRQGTPVRLAADVQALQPVGKDQEQSERCPSGAP